MSADQLFRTAILALAALAAAACAALPSAGGGQTQHAVSTPVSQTHFWGALSEEPDAPPSHA